MPKKNTKESFERKGNLVHDNKFDYSLVVYLNNKTKICIVCLIHGRFYQRPDRHLSGDGCPMCGGTSKKTLQKFIEQGNQKHKLKYDYTKFEYVNDGVKGVIVCNKHGDFLQTPNDHLSGCGCPKCHKDKLQSLNMHKLEQAKLRFSHTAELIHNKYDYSQVNYIGNNRKVTIICPIHGSFEQTPRDHLGGHGCSTCKQSKGEEEIRKILYENNIQFKRQIRFKNCKSKRQLPFDFGIIDKNGKILGLIEYNGKQHYMPVFWNSKITREQAYKTLEQCKERDNIKKSYCLKHDIPLTIISYEDTLHKKLYSFLKINTPEV